MSNYHRKLRPLVVAGWIFAAALVCLVAAILTAEGWDVAERLFALAGVLGFAAFVAVLAGAP